MKSLLAPGSLKELITVLVFSLMFSLRIIFSANTLEHVLEQSKT